MAVVMLVLITCDAPSGAGLCTERTLPARANTSTDDAAAAAVRGGWLRARDGTWRCPWHNGARR